MEYQKVFESIKSLQFDKKMEVISAEGVYLWVFRPSVVPPRYKNYDLNKNFQIWLTEGSRKFKPNHLRVMIDLNLRSRSRPDLKRKLFQAFDEIFYKKDPDDAIEPLSGEHFDHFLNPLKIIDNLSQLFIIEQDYNYNKESKFDPPSLFYQGWLRQAIDDTKEIDNLCMSVGRGLQHPSAKFTSLENKKNNKFTPKIGPLWYLTDQK